MSTLADFRAAVSAVIGLDNTDGGDEQALIDKWVNEAVVQVLRLTRLRVMIANLDLTAGDKDYELPSGIMFVTEIVDANGEPLEQVPADEIYGARRVTSSSGLTYRYAINGANMIMFYPTPAANDTLTFYYVPKPTPMTEGTDDPSASAFGGIQTEYHRAIELYALWRAADYGDDSSSQQGDRYQRDFRVEVGLIRSAMRRRGKAGLPPMRLRSARAIRITDPSQSPRFV